MKRTAALVGLAWFASSWAVGADYLPLQVGNQWVFESASARPELLNIEVLRSRILNGQSYYLVSGYAPGTRWIRQADGKLYALDEATGQDELLADFTAGNAAYNTSLGGCSQGAQASAGKYSGPNYQAPDDLEVQYVANGCADIGLTREIYAAGIGLVRRGLTTIRGETTFDLVYARVNGAAVLGTSKEIVLVYDFNSGSRGWLAGFSDYNLRTADLEMMAELRALPEEVGTARSGFYLQSMNRSDDLFMFVKKYVSPADGLEPNQPYRIAFDLRFLSNAPSGSAGIGGSPGDSVYLKAGATADEPLAILGENGDIRLTADKGQQAMGGNDVGVVGTIANGTDGGEPPWPWVRVQKTYAHPQPVRTDERGSLWLMTGTDSGFEGLTGLYFESISVRISPAVEAAK